jgi:hypothetical protein
MAYESGGFGLWSTIDDYLKFAGPFVGDGEVNGGVSYDRKRPGPKDATLPAI